MSTTQPMARRTRVEPGIYTRPDGTFEIGFRDAAGKQRWRKVSGGIRAARTALAQAKAERARGVKIAVDPRLKFADAASAWWNARVVRLRTATQETYAGHVARLGAPEFFGRKRMSEITPTDVAEFVVEQQRAGLKGSTIKGQLSVLSAVFRYSARHLGLVGPNPVALLDRVERPSSDDAKPKRVLTADEVARLLDAFEPRYRLLFEVAVETGARLGEVLGLVWDDIDLKAQTITFAAQLDRKGKRQPLKTARSRRCLEITPALASGLAAHRAACGRLAGFEFVFQSTAGTALERHNISRRVLGRAVKKAGLEAAHDRLGDLVVPAPTFHSLRHSHASASIAAGWDIAEVSARLGHADIVITQRTYVHQFDAARRSGDRRDRLVALYGSGETTPEATVPGTKPQALVAFVEGEPGRQSPLVCLERDGYGANSNG